MKKKKEKVTVGRSRVFLERECKTKVSYNKKTKIHDDDDDGASFAAAGTDRLSHLPEHILHHILTRLPMKEVVKTCILSKTLLSLWLSFPVLEFEHVDMRNPMSCMSKDKFLNLLERTIQRRSKHASVLQKFRISLGAYNLKHYELMCVDEVISLVINKGVKEFVLNSYDYPLPDIAFGRSITSLTLVGPKVKKLNQLLLGCPLLEYLYLMNCSGPEHFKIVGRKIKSFHLQGKEGLKSVEIEMPALQFLTFIGRWCHCDHFSLSSNSSCNFLKELELNEAPITDNWIENLLPGLVLLEKLDLTSCNELKNVKVSNHNLKQVKFAWCEGLQVIEVRVTDLESFVYMGAESENSKRVSICNINIIHCKHLRKLVLLGYGIHEDFLQEQVSKLLELHGLHVDLLSFQERIEITHENLKHLHMNNRHGILNTEVKIHTPRLVSFTFFGRFVPFVSFHYSATLSATLRMYKIDVLEPSLFEQWYDLIRLMGGCKVLSFDCDCKGLIFPQEVRKVMASPLAHLKHMRVGVALSEMTVELVDSLLWLSPYLDTLVFVTHIMDEMVLSLKFEYEWTTDKEEVEEDNSLCTSGKCYSSRKVDMEMHERVEERLNLLKYFKGDVKSLRIFSTSS